MDDKNREAVEQFIGDSVAKGDYLPLLGLVAGSLVRLACAQEDLVVLAKQDLEDQMEEAVKSRAEQMAQEIDANKSKRGFIGKKS